MNAGTPSKTLRAAIVGGGKMARHHARAIRSLGGRAVVAAVVDPVTEAREAMLELCPEAAPYESLDDALAGPGIDVVHVCSPPPTHARLALTSLQAGCSTYVEKPLAETREEARQLTRTAADRNLVLCAGHQLLFEAPAARLRELLPSIGPCVHIESYFSFRPVRRARAGGTPMRVEEQLLDVLPHPVYLLLACLRRAAPNGETELRGIEVGRSGTVHALVGRGELNASLVVSLAGRPVESYVRIVGENGLVVADFVRSTTQRLVGPGASGIDKLLNPFRLSRQLATQTTASLAGRFVKRRRSYPGLAEIFSAFYGAVDSGQPPPIDAAEMVETVDLCEQIGRALPGRPEPSARTGAAGPAAGMVAVTGGTGFLGREVVRALAAQRIPARALARRVPPRWDRVTGVEYVATNLGAGIPPSALVGADTVIHCAAETAGGWEEHQANSLDATENLFRAAAAAGVRRVVHVSSLAVLAGGRDPVTELTPLVDPSRSRGPYVWGKLESERTATRLAAELGLALKIVRPGALVDYERFEPPGRLGRRIGNVFIAVGRRRDELGITSLRFCADTLVWISRNFELAPDAVNLIEPDVPTKRELVTRLKDRNPDLLVMWLPRVVLQPLSWVGLALQRVLRPGIPPINVAKVFARERYDTTASELLAGQMRALPVDLPPDRRGADPRTDGERSQEAGRLGELSSAS